jgi:hypothetical protein
LHSAAAAGAVRARASQRAMSTGTDAAAPVSSAVRLQNDGHVLQLDVGDADSAPISLPSVFLHYNSSSSFDRSVSGDDGRGRGRREGAAPASTPAPLGTGQRVCPASAVSSYLHEPIVHAELSDGGRQVVVSWQLGDRASFQVEWLREHAREARGAEEEVEAEGEEGSGAAPASSSDERIAHYELSELVRSDRAMLALLRSLVQRGIAVVECGAGAAPAASATAPVTALANRIAWPMRTIYGDTFRVEAKADPINIAYSSKPLDL